jgi:three-Cys-motif partner protein
MANDQGSLFSGLPPLAGKPIKFTPVQRPLWTENKAKLIERYLFYFVLLTKHGAYIDGFAGPQNPKSKNDWAAKLVLESQPPLLREFWLCELNKNGVDALRSLKQDQPIVKGRTIEIVPGDFNETVHNVIRRCGITDKTASFCLLDQRTFECHWTTVETLAKFKKGGHKIELFYFLASSWLDRSLKGTTKNIDQIDRWWGRPDWKQLRGMKSYPRAELLAKRLRDELGYAHAYAWPIYKRGSRGRIMYHMVHATDHPEAPKLMHRAYFNATKAREPIEKLQMDLGALWAKSPDVTA